MRNVGYKYRNEIMKRTKAFLMLPLMLLIALAAGQAVVKDFRNNEFDPLSRWS
jgi:hypothetical protein